MIESAIFEALNSDTDLNTVFKNNISPLSGKKSELPSILYQLYQTDSVQTKNTGELMGEYVLRLHIFSEKYSDVVFAVQRLKELLDFQEIVDDETGDILIDLIRFRGFREDYRETDEVFNRTIEFTVWEY